MTITLLLLLAGAPAPAHRPAPPAPVVGAWVMHWGGASGRATFAPGGSYAWGAWSGRWEWDARTRTLTVDEAALGGVARLRWSARLDARLSGAVVPLGGPPCPVSLRRVSP